MQFINNQRFAQLAGVNFDSEKIQQGPIVYSRTHEVVRQFGKLKDFPECILITSFSDAQCTDEMADKLPLNIKKWYTNNVDTNNPRVEIIPIGLRTSSEGEDVLRKAINIGRLPNRNLMYMNFMRNIPRVYNPREGIYEQFLCKKWVTGEGGFEHVPMEQFYGQILSHPFTLSPPGAGPDCHRHWESIILGSIPVVLKSKTTEILNGLPCFQVNNWDEVTATRLRMEYPRLKELFKSPRMEICYFEYWKEKIMKEAECI